MTFRLLSASYMEKPIQLAHEWGPSNYVTLLVGRNGTGKSRFLSAVCNAFNAMDFRLQTSALSSVPRRHDKQIELTFGLDERIVRLRSHKRQLETDEAMWIEHIRPQRVIATTITPFDKFPIGRSNTRPDDTKMHRYKYLGSKNRLGQASGSGRLSRTVEALMLTSEKSDARQQQLRHVFEFLGYAPTITVQYSLRITREAIDATVGAWQSGSHEHLRRELLRIDTPFRYRFQASETESWEMFAVAEAIAALADHGTKKNIVNFELSFESGEFQAGSLDLYVHVQTLRRFGLATLRSLRLDRQSDGASVELRDASSGEQSVVLTLLGIASEIESDSLVIIDEPEISLHPEWQERFLPLMLKTFENYSGCHFLLATHSPQILASMQALARGTIVLMDSGESTSAVGQSKKSADYQLATAFQSPGFGNEYLARIGLNALALINKRHLDSDELRAAVLTLRRARPKLSESDPVAMLADVVFAAEEFRQ